MALKDHVLNLNKIHGIMKNKPVRYRLYNFFQGVPDMLDLEQLTELKKIAMQENNKLIKGLDKKIAEIAKHSKPQQA